MRKRSRALSDEATAAQPSFYQWEPAALEVRALAIDVDTMRFTVQRGGAQTEIMAATAIALAEWILATYVKGPYKFEIAAPDIE